MNVDDRSFIIADGSHQNPFSQAYLNERMRTVRVRRGMYNRPSAQDCYERFIESQARKIQAGISVCASPNLLLEIKRRACATDLDI